MKKVSMPAWKRTTKKGKSIELTRKKQFKKKRTERKLLLHMPLKKAIKTDQKKGNFIVFEKVLK